MENLLEKWAKMKRDNPRLRIREAAGQLNVSEAQLVAASAGLTNVRLTGDFKGLLKEIETLGPVMALTRNEHCVHERKGVYRKVSFNGEVGLAVNPDIDLRLFMSQWKFGFSVNENGRHSFQFFDHSGVAVHKIYLTEHSDESIFHALTEKYRDGNQTTDLQVQEIMPQSPENALKDIDVPAFQKAWAELQDTHDFHGMLRTHGVSRRQAMELGPEGYTEQLDVAYLKKMLEAASAQSVEVMVFTGSRGCIQIHTGYVKNLVQTGPWFNVLDPDFNMHLREDGIESVWMVRKPTKDGIVTSMEVFDREGQIIVQFFGKRKPGIPESEAWRSIVNQTPETV